MLIPVLLNIKIEGGQSRCGGDFIVPDVTPGLRVGGDILGYF